LPNPDTYAANTIFESKADTSVVDTTPFRSLVWEPCVHDIGGFDPVSETVYLYAAPGSNHLYSQRIGGRRVGLFCASVGDEYLISAVSSRSC